MGMGLPVPSRVTRKFCADIAEEHNRRSRGPLTANLHAVVISSSRLDPEIDKFKHGAEESIF
jgi:hypothetical protein